MRSVRGQHDGAAVGFGTSAEQGYGSGICEADIRDYVAHISDLLEELQSMAATDARMDLLSRILGLAIEEAGRISSQPASNRR